MNGEVLEFFREHLDALPLYEELEARILTAVPAATIKVCKTQVSFSTKRGFAFVSFLPCRKAKERPQTWLTLSFGQRQRVQSPRIDVATEPYPNRWTHHVMLTQIEELDDELMGWIQDAAAAASLPRGR